MLMESVENKITIKKYFITFFYAIDFALSDFKA
jgi:hypothetical protein